MVGLPIYAAIVLLYWVNGLSHVLSKESFNLICIAQSNNRHSHKASFQESGCRKFDP